MTYPDGANTVDTYTIATETSGACGATVAALKAVPAKAPDDSTRIFTRR
jgi:hypothetical protein